MSSRAKTLALALLRKNRGSRDRAGVPWRKISADDYSNGVNPTTLCRFAKSRGSWVPKNRRIQELLGLRTKRTPRPRPRIVCQIMSMAELTRIAAFGWKDKHA
jgi:hypothetical protein